MSAVTILQVALGAGIVLGLLGFVWWALRSIRKRGEAEARQEMAQEAVDQAKEGARIDEEVAGLDPNDVHDELR